MLHWMLIRPRTMIALASEILLMMPRQMCGRVDDVEGHVDGVVLDPGVERRLMGMVRVDGARERMTGKALARLALRQMRRYAIDWA